MAQHKYTTALKDGYVLTFNDDDEVKAWVKKEKTVWDNFINLVKGPDGKKYKSYTGGISKQQINSLTPLESTVHQNGNVQNELTNLGTTSFIASESDRGKFVDALLARNPLLAVGALFSWDAKILESTAFQSDICSNNPQTMKEASFLLTGVSEATIFEKGLSQGLGVEKRAFKDRQAEVDRLSTELKAELTAAKKAYAEKTKALDDAKSRFEKTTEEKIKEFDKKINENIKTYDTSLDELGRKTREDYQNTEKFFKEGLALKAPVTYWRSRAHWCTFWFWVFSILFLSAIGLSCVASEAYIKYVLTSISKIAEAKSMIPTVFGGVIGFTIFCLVWILRLLSKTVLSYQSQANDAKLRSTMTLTYLALLSENKADEKERLLILNALFHIPNQSNEDGSPPHWFELLQSKNRYNDK